MEEVKYFVQAKRNFDGVVQQWVEATDPQVIADFLLMSNLANNFSVESTEEFTYYPPEGEFQWVRYEELQHWAASV